jgi:uncharacterized protein (DUF58 family)
LTAVSLREQAEALGGSLPPLLVAAERLASSVSLGVHGRRKSGMGETFWQFRRYAPEDAQTAIDWRQSGKSDHLFVREREWEAAEAVYLWRDGSPGMRFQSPGTPVSKLERATVLALALGFLLIRGGERIGLLGDAQSPATGRARLRRIAYELIDAPPRDEALPPDARMMKNSQFVWFGDFLSPLTDIETALRRLAHAGLSGYLVHIIDPAEEDFPFAGRLRFEAASGGESEVFGRAESIQGAYRSRFRAHGESLRALTRRFGWSYLAHRTDRRPETALVALYTDMGGAPARMRTA